MRVEREVVRERERERKGSWKEEEGERAKNGEKRGGRKGCNLAVPEIDRPTSLPALPPPAF